MAVGTKTAWRYKAEYLELCNCADGCPCNFSGFPTQGNCRGVLGYRMTEGKCGDVDLAGVTLALAFSWPGAIHEGDGTVAVFFDPSASQKQMDAVAGIFMNEHGGLPHEIIATTITTVLGPFVEPIDFKFSGPDSSLRVGTKILGRAEAYRSPVEPHDEQEVKLVLPNGFIFTEANAVRNAQTSVKIDGLAFNDQMTNGFYTVVEHHN